MMIVSADEEQTYGISTFNVQIRYLDKQSL